jgi:dTDP-4-dehydrorhamnose reductase
VNTTATSTTILVTGANGQLGREMQVIAAAYPACNFLFVSRETLSIEDAAAVKDYLDLHTVNVLVNCAAYTAVDKAESEPVKAFAVNGYAVGTLATVCREKNIGFIHISTDYVFDGTATTPYKENDPVHPIGVYGASKLKGEELALQNNPASIIIRTSWVYSSFGNNFVKTMLRLMKERSSINVVDDQLGCPTYAADLAAAVMQIIAGETQTPGIYNFSNSGIINWFQFASAIKELSGSSCIVHPIPSSQYPTPAKRPAYSVLDTEKIQTVFGVTVPAWKQSLERCLQILNG